MPDLVGPLNTRPLPSTPPAKEQSAAELATPLSLDTVVDARAARSLELLTISRSTSVTTFEPIERRTVDMLTKAGLPVEDAITLATRGASDEQATEMLNLALMTDAKTLQKMAALSERLKASGVGVRARIADRLEATIKGSPDLQEIAALAKTKKALGAEMKRIDAALSGRFKKEADALDAIPADSRLRTRIERLRTFADEAGIDIHRALAHGSTAAQKTGLSAPARQALKKIDAGANQVRVATRADALELLSQFPNLVETGGWGWQRIKGLLGEDWDYPF